MALGLDRLGSGLLDSDFEWVGLQRQEVVLDFRPVLCRAAL